MCSLPLYLSLIHIYLGIVQALTAALFYGISATLNKMLTNDGILFAQQIYQSFFVVITSAVYVLFKYRSLKINVPELPRKIKREIILPVIGGVLFFGNNCFSVMAYDCMEAVSYTHLVSTVTEEMCAFLKSEWEETLSLIHI